ncbi:MAG: FKBP-type peptidyl-prolyl cis-trans isomerase [Pirellulales bacterium]
MKRIFPAVAALALSASAAFAQDAQPASTAPDLKDSKAKVSYLIGTNIGRQMKSDGMDLDLEIFVAGMRDAIAGAKSKLSDEEAQAVIAEFQAQQMAKQKEQMNAAAKQQLEGNAELKAQYEKNTAEGKAFLEANGKKEGITTLPSGIQYKVLKSGDGTGRNPAATDTVTTHYKGTLLDGKVFDSSYDRGQPASFPLNGVISGWTEVLQKMKPGDKWEVYIPGEHAYGIRGTGDGTIGPNALLTFEIELIGIAE